MAGKAANDPKMAIPAWLRSLRDGFEVRKHK